MTEHYRSLYHKLPDLNRSEPSAQSTDKLQTDPSFVDFKRSVTVSFDRELLREIKSPSQSPDRSGAGERDMKRESEDVTKRESEDVSGRTVGDGGRSPGASIRSPSLSPPPSETSSPGM